MAGRTTTQDSSSKGEKVRSPFVRLLTENRTGLLLPLLAGLGLVIPGILIPAFSRIFIDNILVEGKIHWLPVLLVAMFVTMVVRSLLAWLQRSVLLDFMVRYSLVSASRLFHQILRLPMAFFFRQYAGEISSRMELSNHVAKLVSQESATISLRLILALFYGAAMFMYDIALGTIGVAMALAGLLAVQWTARRRRVLNMEYLEQRERFLGMGMAGIQNMATIKATASEQDFFNRWSGLQATSKGALNRLEKWTRLMEPLPLLLSDLGTVAILGVGAVQVMRGELTMGEVVAVLSLQAMFSEPVRDIVRLFGTFQAAGGYLDRLDQILRQEQDPRFQARTKHLPMSKPRLEGALKLDKLSFGYNRSQPPLIRDFSLEITPGSRIALVGETGSGKSTVANLVAGLYEPWDGTILFDGLREQDIDPGVMHLSRAVVSQSPFLFEGSVRDNIAMWNTALDEADIIRAAKDACIHDDISSRPGGYDAPVAEAGANFSGGQRQRLEIAKALAVNPSLIIMDEATSALDPRQEKDIDDNLRRRGITCLIIAHRLSTVRDCDEIVVLDRGKITERGTHSELYALNGRYTRLVNQ